MFHNSSHKKFWIFKGEDEVEHMRYKANRKFRNKILESGKVSSSHADVKFTHFLSNRSVFLYYFIQPGVNESIFLERHEEDVLFRYYERRMLDFCNAFKPAMPKSVVVCVFYLCNI